MKIGFPVDSNNLDALVKERMSSATWLLVVDTEDMNFEAVPAPQMSAGSGSGIQALTILLERGAQMLMVGYIAPHIVQSLEKSGITVITGVSGRVKDRINQYAEFNNSMVSTPQKEAVRGAF